MPLVEFKVNLKEMSNRTEIIERFKIISRANSFLKSHNLNFIDTKLSKNIFNKFFITETNLAPITISQLENLYFHTIYISVYKKRRRRESLLTLYPYIYFYIYPLYLIFTLFTFTLFTFIPFTLFIFTLLLWLLIGWSF